MRFYELLSLNRAILNIMIFIICTGHLIERVQPIPHNKWAYRRDCEKFIIQ